MPRPNMTFSTLVTARGLGSTATAFNSFSSSESNNGSNTVRFSVRCSVTVTISDPSPSSQSSMPSTTTPLDSSGPRCFLMTKPPSSSSSSSAHKPSLLSEDGATSAVWSTSRPPNPIAKKLPLGARVGSGRPRLGGRMMSLPVGAAVKQSASSTPPSPLPSPLLSAVPVLVTVRSRCAHVGTRVGGDVGAAVGTTVDT